MKTYFFTLVCMIAFTTNAQDVQTTTPVTVKEGNLTKVSFYHENGQVAQEGYLKNNKLHGKWVKYADNGELLCIANYSRGKRKGTWLFWDNNKNLTEVEFKNNKILQQLTFTSEARVVAVDK